MPRYIIHKDGVFNVFSTVVDACIFEPMTREDIEAWLKEQSVTEPNMREVLMERALRKGTSSETYESLEETISHNRAGPNETSVPFEQFVRHFLTLPETRRGIRKVIQVIQK